MNVPLKDPRPDIRELRETILRGKKPCRVHVDELHIDAEFVRYVTQRLLHRTWVEPDPADRASQEVFLDNHVECWYRLGFDAFRPSSSARLSANISYVSRGRTGRDTASLARSERRWTEEGKGIIASWEDFEKYPWPAAASIDLWPFEYLSRHLPEGMGIWICLGQGVLETVMNALVGLEPLSYLMHDQPDLASAIFERAGQILLDGYRRLVGLDRAVGFFQGDDMGYRTGTLLSPDVLRKHVLPWHRQFARLAHENGLLYVLHSCGNTDAIMADLIEDVKIDAKHSFEDAIQPVTEFRKKYGTRVAAIGGVDVDRLCILREADLRAHVRGILEECMAEPGYVLGSGNSVANYVPAESYLAMLDEGFRVFR